VEDDIRHGRNMELYHAKDKDLPAFVYFDLKVDKKEVFKGAFIHWIIAAVRSVYPPSLEVGTDVVKAVRTILLGPKAGRLGRKHKANTNPCRASKYNISTVRWSHIAYCICLVCILTGC
jgi:hypothetical protein